MPSKRQKRSQYAKDNPKPNDALKNFLLKHASPEKGFSSMADLARKAGLNTSIISMAISGRRSLGVDAAFKIAKTLRPPTHLAAFAQELFEKASLNSSSEEFSLGSAADRVLWGQKIKVGYIASEPFVHAGGKTGFAVELFDHLARLMNLSKYSLDPLEFKQLKSKLSDDEFDIIVAGVIPTYNRRTFMSFSRPWPYLRISVTCLVKKEFEEKANREGNFKLAVAHLLEPKTSEQEVISKAKLMLVEGEAGEEFTNAFFPRDLIRKLKSNRNIMFAESLAPEKLAGELVEKNPDLFIADVGTCKALMDNPQVSDRFSPISDSDTVEPSTVGTPQFPELAVYRIAFGLRRNDQAWQVMIDEAFDCMLTEGLRSLTSLYHRYFIKDQSPFRHLLLLEEEDNAVQSTIASRAFKTMFGIK